MNINKKLIKGTAITAAAVTIMATAGINMANAADTNKLGADQNNIVKVADNTAVNVKADNTAFKDETVYVMADSTGAAKNIIVSDWLKNFNASAGLSDFSTLSNLVNVKGNETFDQNSNQVTWNADGNDIYYQGTSDAELPVNVKVTYTLDGTEMSAADLVGKSGKLTVRYDYTNTLKHTTDINGKTEDIYTPLLMITGAMLPTDKYTNVEVTNGRVVSDGNQQMVVGIALPGLKESLKSDSDKLDIPGYFEYTADVTDYEANPAMSVGLTDILSGMDINGSDLDLDDIQSKVDDLVDGVDKLADGSKKLYDGTGKLADGTGKLVDGADKLVDGANKLADGSDKLYDGSGKLYDGSNTLYEGLSQLLSKTGDFKTGVTTLSNGLTQLQGALGKLQTGAKSLDDGAASLEGGLGKLSTGITSAKDGVDKMSGNFGKLAEGANSIAGGADKLAAGAGTLETSLETVNGTYKTLSDTVANDEALIAALKQVNAQYKDENIAGIIAKMEANTAGQKKIADGLTSAGGQLVEGAKSLKTGAGSLKTGADTLAGGVNALADGGKTLQGAFGQLQKGSNDLLAGAKKLHAGTSSLVTNTKELEKAGKKLSAGGSSLASATDQFSGAIGKLQKGSGTLKDGLGSLKTNVGTFKDGVGTLKDGVVTLKDASGKLDDGANTLNDNMGTLNDGIHTLKKDGIDKITDLVDGDLGNVIERFKAVVDESKAYKNYSGIGDEMDGSVKFIIKYED